MSEAPWVFLTFGEGPTRPQTREKTRKPGKNLDFRPGGGQQGSEKDPGWHSSGSPKSRPESSRLDPFRRQNYDLGGNFEGRIFWGAHIFRKCRPHTAPHGKATGGKGPQTDYLVSNFSEKSRL